jgi:DNA-binding response OmpR family regulator
MPAPSLLHFGPYRLDGTRGQLWRHDAVVHLRPKALAVLWELARQVGQMGAQRRLARHRVGRHGGE